MIADRFNDCGYFVCYKTGRIKNVTNWQKEIIVFGRSKDYNIKEGTGFADVSHSTIKRASVKWKIIIESACELRSEENTH